VDITPDIADIFEKITYALDEPHADDSAIPTWALSQAVGGSYKVASPASAATSCSPGTGVTSAC